MKQRALGNTTVGAIGLGGMPMSIEGRPDESLAEVVLPIPGASRPQSILDSVAAADLELTGAELEALAVDDA
jgi:aryl-alcohol dehydrogenase-like predicted oxidoreductase